MRRWAWVASLAAIAGCKSAGTISLELGGDGGIACMTDAGVAGRRDGGGGGAGEDYVVVFAEPASCDACACGACFGKPGERHVPGCTPDHRCGLADLGGLALPLEPGHWAVVLELFAGDSALRAIDCVDVDVDIDGVADKALAGMGLRCWSDCDQGH